MEPDDEDDARHDQGVALDRADQAGQPLTADQIGVADRGGIREESLHERAGVPVGVHGVDGDPDDQREQ